MAWKFNPFTGKLDKVGADWNEIEGNQSDVNISGFTNDAGYLTTETDPTVPAHVKSITETNISNWDTAYGWGDHSGIYLRLNAESSDVTNGTFNLTTTGTITGGTITDGVTSITSGAYSGIASMTGDFSMNMGTGNLVTTGQVSASRLTVRNQYSLPTVDGNKLDYMTTDGIGNVKWGALYIPSSPTDPTDPEPLEGQLHLNTTSSTIKIFYANAWQTLHSLVSEVGYLLLEDGNYLLQEDGNRIIL